jgi:parallel beta-helix repeat protein
MGKMMKVKILCLVFFLLVLPGVVGFVGEDNHPCSVVKPLSINLKNLQSTMNTYPGCWFSIIQEGATVDERTCARKPALSTDKTNGYQLGAVVLYVGGSGPGNFTTIQSAVDAAEEGDTIFVYDDSSPYSIRNRIIITKTISLIGENAETTIIEKSEKGTTGPCIDIRPEVDNVTIRGFTIHGGTNVIINTIYDTGIVLAGANHWISDNIIEDTYVGIYIYKSLNTVISGNHFYNNPGGAILHTESQGVWFFNNIFINNTGGIILDYQSQQATISNNTFTNDGVFISDAVNTTFSNNIINGKPLLYREGANDLLINATEAAQIILVGCSNISVHGIDTLSSTCCGIILSRSNGCTITCNTLYGHTWGSIFLWRSNENSLTHNDITASQNGMVVRSSQENVFSSNEISSCKNGGMQLKESKKNHLSDNLLSDNHGMILDSSPGNTIDNNTFVRDGLALFGFYEDLINVVSDNTVNGKQLVYLVDESDTVVDEAGQVILLGCWNVTVQNQNLSNTTVGILLADTHTSLINHNTMKGNYYLSIDLYTSSMNNLSFNEISTNVNGIRLSYCSENILWGNSVDGSTIFGINLWDTDHTTISANTITNSTDLGLLLYEADYTDIIKNNFVGNDRDAFFEFHGHFSEYQRTTTWRGNYWERPRILPKLIFGQRSDLAPGLNCDWVPARRFLS